MAFLALFIIYVGVLVLIEWFLRRYTSTRLLPFKFRSGFLKVLAGSCAILLSWPIFSQAWFDAGNLGSDLELWAWLLIPVMLILSPNLILLGLIDVIGAAIKMIHAAMKKRQA